MKGTGAVQPPSLAVEIEQEEDGRWLAEVPAVPGALAYGSAPQEASAKAEALALRALAERLECSEPVPEIDGWKIQAAGAAPRLPAG